MSERFHGDDSEALVVEEADERNAKANGIAALPWGFDKKELKPSSMNNITDEKLAHFVIGRQEKSIFEKKKEERLAKKRKAEEEAAKVYEQFVASFEDAEEKSGKTFVREHSSQHTNTTESSTYRLHNAFSNENGDDQPPSGRPSKKKTKSNMDLMLEEMKQNENEMKKPGKKRREIDNFLEEMKQRTPTVPSEGEMATATGSFDTGDRTTTNLYVGNLAPTITEEDLQAEFGKFGRILSIKIMWPRTEAEKIRQRNCGFVSFYERSDAADAKMSLDDTELKGQPISICWGKPVKVPPNLALLAVGAPTIKNLGQNIISPSVSTLIMHPRDRSDDDAPRVRPNVANLSKNQVEIVFPKQKEDLELINRLARYVAKDGSPFEDEIAKREARNPSYYFLREGTSDAALYYRWKVYSLAMGDSESDWEESPFQMISNGYTYVPPKNPNRKTVDRLNEKRRREASQRPKKTAKDDVMDTSGLHLMTGQQIAKARERKRGQERSKMTDEEYEEFQDLLDGVTSERTSIREAMGFALDCSECAKDVSKIVWDRMMEESAAPNKCVALLFLVSDLLYNSTARVPNASLYRTQLEEYLPEIFTKLRKIYMAIPGRMSSSMMKGKVMSVLRAWKSWCLFPPLYLMGLHATFSPLELSEEEINSPYELKITIDALKRRCRQAGLVSDGLQEELVLRCRRLYKFTQQLNEETAKGTIEVIEIPETILAMQENMVEIGLLKREDMEMMKASSSAAESAPHGSNQIDDDIDGEPIEDEDVDGEPMEDDDLDGEPMDDEDMDGEPMEDEGVDGEPMEDEDGEALDEGDADGQAMD